MRLDENFKTIHGGANYLGQVLYSTRGEARSILDECFAQATLYIRAGELLPELEAALVDTELSELYYKEEIKYVIEYLKKVRAEKPKLPEWLHELLMSR